jgi:hypothetical protein
LGALSSEFGNSSISRIWEKNWSLSPEFGIPTSGDISRCWEMLGMIFWLKIDGVDQSMKGGLCSGFEIGIRERISLSRNGYLFSKERKE